MRGSSRCGAARPSPPGRGCGPGAGAGKKPHGDAWARGLALGLLVWRIPSPKCRRQGLRPLPLSISARVFSCRSMNHPRRGLSLLPPPAQATSPPPLQPSYLHPQKTRPPAPYPLPPPQSTTRPATARLHQILTNGTSKTLKQNNKKPQSETKQKRPK